MAGEANLCCNIIWVVFGGFGVCVWWCFIGLFICCTIIGIPAGIQCFKIGCFALCPFGKQIIPKEGGLSGCDFCLNIIWILIFGLWTAIFEIFIGCFFCITICGIPFGIQWFKIAKITFMPFGARILDTDAPPTTIITAPAQPPIVVVQTGAPVQPYPQQQMGYTAPPGYTPPPQPY